MLLQLLILATSGLLLATLALVIGRIISLRLALLRFKKKSSGLPMCPDVRLIGNHLLTVPLKENNCEELMKTHRKLGPTVGFLRCEKPCASTTDLDLIKTIVLDESHLHIDRAKMNMPMVEFENNIMLASGEAWRRARRVIAPALKPNKFKTPNVIHEIEESINKLIGHIARTLNKAPKPDEHQFNADDFVHKYSLDLVFSCFYKQYRLIDFDDPKDWWTNLIEDGLQSVQNSVFVKMAMIFPVVRDTIDWLMWHLHPQGVCRQKIREFVQIQTKLGIEARRQLQDIQEDALKQPEERKFDSSNFLLRDGTNFRRNMIDYVIDQFLDGKLTATEYFYNTGFLLGAADKTSADCIAHTLYLLSVHQDVQDKLRESIKVDGADSEYLGWVLNESLRLLPPVSIGCSRNITRDIELKEGHVLPKDTLVVTCGFIIHRLKEFWGEDAEEFKPERWQDTSHHHPMQFIPFGAGNRVCPGREFALFEMRMLFAALLSRYKFEGPHRADAYKFNTPFWIFVIPNSPTYLTIKRLDT